MRSMLAGVAKTGSETAQRLEGFASVRSTLAGLAERGSETAQRLEGCEKNNSSPPAAESKPINQNRTKNKTEADASVFFFFAIAIFQFNCVAVVLAKISLSLNSAAAAALYESVHFIDRHAVEIAFDCVFQARSRGCKFYGVRGGLAVYKAVYKSCAE